MPNFASIFQLQSLYESPGFGRGNRTETDYVLESVDDCSVLSANLVQFGAELNSEN